MESLAALATGLSFSEASSSRGWLMIPWIEWIATESSAGCVCVGEGLATGPSFSEASSSLSALVYRCTQVKLWVVPPVHAWKCMASRGIRRVPRWVLWLCGQSTLTGWESPSLNHRDATGPSFWGILIAFSHRRLPTRLFSTLWQLIAAVWGNLDWVGVTIS